MHYIYNFVFKIIAKLVVSALNGISVKCVTYVFIGFLSVEGVKAMFSHL